MNFIKKLIWIFLLWVFFCSFVNFQYQNIKTNEPLSIHLLEINPKKYLIKPFLAKENEISRDTVLNITKNYKAKAAINGGFFKIDYPIDGLPAGSLKIEGNWIALDQKQRAAIGWNKNCFSFIIDRLDTKAYITLDGNEFPINGINCQRKENERILYLDNFFNLYTTDPANLKSFMILSYNCFLATDPLDDLVKILKPYNFNYKIYIEPQSSLNTKKIWEKLENIVGGTPLLIHSGKKIEDYSSEHTRLKFLTDKYARTAIGIKENGNLVFLVVDGNDQYHSIGMTINELRDFLYDLGCVYALNLDGGGSSTMVIDNKIINNLEKDEDDLIEDNQDYVRKVSNAILIFERED